MLRAATFTREIMIGCILLLFLPELGHAQQSSGCKPGEADLIVANSSDIGDGFAIQLNSADWHYKLFTISLKDKVTGALLLSRQEITMGNPISVQTRCGTMTLNADHSFWGIPLDDATLGVHFFDSFF